jgi:hypothetical protein
MLTSLEGEDLVSSIIQSDPNSGPPTVIGPGLRIVILFWISLDTLPGTIIHRIQVKLGDDPEPLTLEYAGMPVGTHPIRLSPPLRGDRWLALNASNNTHHRRGLMVLKGKIQVPQRFAIDFVQLDSNGNSHDGDPKQNRNYVCYGAEALAVADAKVVSVKEGIPENVPDNTVRAVPITLDTGDGNYVALDLGSGQYAFYAHLQPGSIRVKPGDQVRCG